MKKKRLLSLLLALAMSVSLFSNTAFAVDDPDAAQTGEAAAAVDEIAVDDADAEAPVEAETESDDAVTPAAPETAEEAPAEEPAEAPAQEEAAPVEAEAVETEAQEDAVPAAEAEAEPFSGYVLMNIPYTVFYQQVVGASNGQAIDAITSATSKNKAAYFWDGSTKSNAEVAYGADKTISGVAFPVALSAEDYAKLNTELTDADPYYVEVLDAEPALYVNATVADGGAVTFGALSEQPKALAGATATITDSSKYGDYLIEIDNDGGVLTAADRATFGVYGAVLKTADQEYTLYHLENIYYKDFQELAFCTKSEANAKGFAAHKDYFSSLEGETITEIVYYTTSGAYSIATSLKVAPFSGYVLMNIPYDVFYQTEGATIGDVDAVSSATNKTGNYGKAGGAFHSAVTAEVASDGTVTAVGGANGSQPQGVIWAVKADSLTAVQALGGVEINDASSVVTATVGRGQASSQTLVGYEALTEAPAYSYYVLDSAPDYYMVLSGGTFSATNPGATQSQIEIPVSYGTNWGDVQLNVSAASDASDKLVNAIVLTADDGTTVGLYHLDQIWSASELAWKVAFTSGMDGKTITNIRYYCTVKDNDTNDDAAPAYVNYVYDYPTSTAISQVYTGTVTADFTDANTITVTGLPEDAANVMAKVYYTTGGRNATYTYLTPKVVDPQDDDIDPIAVAVVDGKISIVPGSVTNNAGTTERYGEPISGTTYTIELSSDNYII